jgi:hypothetical protein
MVVQVLLEVDRVVHGQPSGDDVEGQQQPHPVSRDLFFLELALEDPTMIGSDYLNSSSLSLSMLSSVIWLSSSIIIYLF